MSVAWLLLWAEIIGQKANGWQELRRLTNRTQSILLLVLVLSYFIFGVLFFAFGFRHEDVVQIKFLLSVLLHLSTGCQVRLTKGTAFIFIDLHFVLRSLSELLVFRYNLLVFVKPNTLVNLVSVRAL